MSAAASEITWMVRLLEDLGIHNIKPVTLHCVSQSTLHIAHNPILHGRTKHIEVDSHFTRKKVMEGLIQLKYLLLVNWRTCSQRFFLLTTSRIYFPNLACFLHCHVWWGGVKPPNKNSLVNSLFVYSVSLFLFQFWLDFS